MTVSRRKALTTAVIIIFTLACILFVAQGFEGENERRKDSPVIFNQNVFSPYKLPDSVSFAGERIPLENFDTRESLEREVILTAYRHASTIMIIKRATRYFPVVEKILKEYNVPDDFKYLAVAESELSNMISPAGATGFWQIMPET
jgi:membrane-bound lytic murein transglycosylase D